VFLLDPTALAQTRAAIAAGDGRYAVALKRLLSQAEAALGGPTYSVVQKPQLPPSGDKHDYLSQARYYWPDPSKPGGLPYLQRDGETNPEIELIPDHALLDRMLKTVGTLSLAFYFSADERYAERATLLLRTWFVDSDTRMNPNMTYAQFVPGENSGRPSGLIDSRGFSSLGDDIGLLADSPAWTEADQQGMSAWLAKYLDWLQTSANGTREAAAQNNHGTFYDGQVIAIALFLGQTDLAGQVAEASKTKRITRQIEPDGRQPLELSRTRSWSYSLFNLAALFDLASLADRAGVDLWRLRTDDGRSLRAALDFLLPYAQGADTWPYQQISSWSPSELVPLLYQAAIRSGDQRYLEACQQIAGDGLEADRLNLVYDALPNS